MSDDSEKHLEWSRGFSGQHGGYSDWKSYRQGQWSSDIHKGTNLTGYFPENDRKSDVIADPAAGEGCAALIAIPFVLLGLFWLYPLPAAITALLWYLACWFFSFGTGTVILSSFAAVVVFYALWARLEKPLAAQSDYWRARHLWRVLFPAVAVAALANWTGAALSPPLVVLLAIALGAGAHFVFMKNPAKGRLTTPKCAGATGDPDSAEFTVPFRSAAVAIGLAAAAILVFSYVAGISQNSAAASSAQYAPRHTEATAAYPATPGWHIPGRPPLLPLPDAPSGVHVFRHLEMADPAKPRYVIQFSGIPARTTEVLRTGNVACPIIRAGTPVRLKAFILNNNDRGDYFAVVTFPDGLCGGIFRGDAQYVPEHKVSIQHDTLVGRRSAASEQ